MSANRLFVLVIAVALAIVAALVARQAVATMAIGSTGGRLDDYYQRHPSLSIPAPSQQVDYAGSDYYQRHRAELIAARGVDTTDYAARHPELSLSSAPQVDLTDYYFRHPAIGLSAARQVDLTDYYFRHPELSGR